MHNLLRESVVLRLALLALVLGAFLAAPLATAAQDETVIVATDVLNLRDGPGLDYAVLTELYYGTAVTLLGDIEVADDYLWALVLTEYGDVGWVATEYLAFVDGDEGTMSGVVAASR